MQERQRRAEQGRELYYIDGSTVRRREVAEPERKVARKKQHKQQKKNITYPKAAARAEKSLYFDKGYTVVLIIAALIMLVSFGVVVSLQGKVDEQERNIRNMQLELQEIEADNASMKEELSSKYSLDYIYQVATKNLGMVYAKKGQIVYYEQANEDYVKQMRDVPEAR